MTDIFITATQKRDFLNSAIRVNHAGERAAKNIYSSQIKFTKDPETKKLLAHMLEQELVHLEYFENEMKKSHARPSLLLPLWDFLSHSLGASTAIMGKEAAMMCTEAVEEVIDEHYSSQVKKLENSEMKNKIEQFRQEELEHKNIAISNDAHLSPAYKILSKIIKSGCRIAINLSKKI
jgi:ubiquinone biosynthesis monooxygenase Coq7